MLAGFALTLVVGLILYLARGLGGGDVKLLTALGAVVGLYLLVYLFFFTAVAGGILGFVALARKQRQIAYAPAIAIGFLILLILRGISVFRSSG